MIRRIYFSIIIVIGIIFLINSVRFVITDRALNILALVNFVLFIILILTHIKYVTLYKSKKYDLIYITFLSVCLFALTVFDRAKAVDGHFLYRRAMQSVDMASLIANGFIEIEGEFDCAKLAKKSVLKQSIEQTELKNILDPFRHRLAHKCGRVSSR